MRRYVVIGLIVLLTACVNKRGKVQLASNMLTVLEKSKPNLDSVKLDVFDFKGLKPLLHKQDDVTYVINFWATWCRPCVKELPYFEKLNTEYAGKNVKVILVSLDFPHLYESKLKPFILNHKIKSKVVALDDADMNSWIPQVNEAWSGAIPATVIYRNGKRKFFEQSFTYEELENEVALFLK
ncbi:TlpA disulfide reductase family protein [Snuella lapsa]